MTNAQNGLAAVSKPFPMSLAVAQAGRFTARLWCRTIRITAKGIASTLARVRTFYDMTELGQLDARELRDLGINQGDFLAIRRGTFRRGAEITEERVIFNPESTREPAPKAEQPDFFRPFGPAPRWYQRYWFGD
jgi:hypothetical protein